MPTTETTRAVQWQSLFKVQNVFMCWILRPLTRRNPAAPMSMRNLLPSSQRSSAVRHFITTFSFSEEHSHIIFTMIYWTTSPFVFGVQHRLKFSVKWTTASIQKYFSWCTQCKDSRIFYWKKRPEITGFHALWIHVLELFQRRCVCVQQTGGQFRRTQLITAAAEKVKHADVRMRIN